MNLAKFRQRIKPWLLPVAMLGGVFLHDIIENISFLSPYLIFTMLFITFCRINPKDVKVTRLSLWLLAIQIVGSVAVYGLLLPVDLVAAQGTFMCVLCPVATAAPVITGMLGGSVTRLATFSILSNVSVAVAAPLLFVLVGGGSQLGFLESVAAICSRVMPMILVPLLLALLLRRVSPSIHQRVSSCQSLSFYIWAVALFIVVGRAVTFVVAEPAEKIPEMLLVAICSGVVCCAQFYFGRKIGGRYGDKVVGGQGLGQKNTILAVWMSLTYLNPLSSIGPASYVLWQNTINSWQLYRRARRGDL